MNEFVEVVLATHPPLEVVEFFDVVEVVLAAAFPLTLLGSLWRYRHNPIESVYWTAPIS